MKKTDKITNCFFQTEKVVKYCWVGRNQVTPIPVKVYGRIGYTTKKGIIPWIRRKLYLPNDVEYTYCVYADCDIDTMDIHLDRLRNTRARLRIAMDNMDLFLRDKIAEYKERDNANR